VARLPISKLVAALEKDAANLEYEKRSVTLKPADIGLRKVFVGLGARSIRLSGDEATLFASVNQTSELVAVDTAAMQIVSRIPVDSYPVGLDLSPDNSELWVTSQGRQAKGGNSVGIFQARYKMKEVVPLRKKEK
jgi:DNA-binding beta-propeller fold protein YncE